MSGSLRSLTDAQIIITGARGKDGTPGANSISYEFLPASAGQTVFTYPGLGEIIVVFANGTRLAAKDWVASGTTVTLAEPRDEGDIIVIVIGAEGGGSLYVGSGTYIDALVNGWVSYPTRAQAIAGVNMQPLLQKLEGLARSLGIPKIQLPPGYWCSWTPQRTYVNDDVSSDQSGIPLLVHGRLEISGPTGGGWATMVRRTYLGLDPAIYANTQILPQNAARNSANVIVGNGQGMPWRGGWAMLVGTPTSGPAPANYSDRPSLTLSGNLDIDGGLTISPLAVAAVPGTILRDSNTPGQSGASPAWYELQPVTGYGWDINDKGIIAAFDTWTGDIRFNGNIRLGGFRGELLYQGGSGGGSVYQDGYLILHDTDGDGLNPGPFYAEFGQPTVQCQNVYQENVNQPYEGWLGNNGFLNMYMINCPGGISIQGGAANATDPNYNYYKPTRLSASVVPVCNINITAINSGRISFGSWLHGNIVAIDTDVFTEGDQFLFSDGPYETHLVVELWADQKPNGSSFGISGASIPGKQSIRNCTFEIHCRQTEHAKAQGYYVRTPVSYQGSFGPNMWVQNGTGLCRQFPQTGGGCVTTPDYRLNFSNNNWDRVATSDGSYDNGGNYYDAGATYDPVFPSSADFCTLRYTSDQTFITSPSPITLPLPEVQPYREGQGAPRVNVGAEWTLSNTGAFPVTIPPGNANGGQTLYQALLMPPKTDLKLVFNGSQWVPQSPPIPYVSPLLHYTPAKAGAAIPAAGGTSDVYTIPLPGVTSNFFAVLSAGFDLPDYLSPICYCVTDAVKFYFRNDHPTATYLGNPSQASASVTPGFSFVVAPAAPATPTVVATGSNREILLSFTDGATGGKPIVGRGIYRGTAPGAEAFYTYFLNPGVFSDTNIVPGTTYYYKTQSVNGFQIPSAMSGETSAAATSTAATSPNAPVLTLEAQNGSILGAWQDNANNGAPITSHKAYIGTTSGSETLVALTQTGFGNYGVIPGLTNGTTYFVKIKATNSAGDSSFSNEASMTPYAAPLAPSIALTPGAGQMSIAITAGSANGNAITGYDLYRDGTFIKTIGTSTPYVDTGLAPGSHTYTLAGRNAAGAGPQSASQTGVTT